MAHVLLTLSSVPLSQYPPYLASPPSDVSSEDMTRYREQYRCVDEVVKIFEMPEFDNGSDEKKKQLKAQVSDLMTKVSARANNQPIRSYPSQLKFACHYPPSHRCKMQEHHLKKSWATCLPNWRICLDSAEVDKRVTRSAL